MLAKQQILIALLSAAVPAIAIAHTGATGAVKVRMDNMGVIAKSTKSIGVMLAGQGEIDHTSLRQNAQKIAGHARQIPADFKMNMKSDVTEASPKIWLEPEKFNAIAADLESAALALEDLAMQKAPREALQVAFKEMGKTCSACHADYRIKKN